MSIKRKIKIKDKEHNIYYQNNPEYFNWLEQIIFKYQSKLTRIICARGRKRTGYNNPIIKLRNWIDEVLPLLKDPIYNYSTKCYWIINNMTDFPSCYVCGNKEYFKYKNVNSLSRGYSQHRTDKIVYCSHQCAVNSPITFKQRENTLLHRYGSKTFNNREKCAQTCLRIYGALSNLQTQKAHSNYGKPYCYKNIKFSSAPELAYYIWLEDHNDQYTFEYEPKEVYQYKFKNKLHRYFPDFKVNGQLVEIKGPHLIDKNGVWIADSRYKSIYSKEEFDLINKQTKAKYNYAMSLNVRVITKNEYLTYIKYVADKYGKNYIHSFKKL